MPAVPTTGSAGAGRGWPGFLISISPTTSGPQAAPATLLVVDDPRTLQVRTGAARRRMAAGATAVVVARDVGELPHVCNVVVEVDRDGRASVRDGRGRHVEDVVVAGLAADVAMQAARHLAGYHDPEVLDGTSRLPDSVDLVALTGPGALSERQLAAAWRARRGRTPQALVGLTADGTVELDLVRDGPHALVAGTTGSGKSELLRSLVAALALGSSPEDLTFLLVDYKGGSAFDACADLPHVVGVITDLDDHLAERALRSLGAELRRREALLRSAGVGDLAAYRELENDEPLARLVVVIDEFATLAAELPEFLRALVGVAQRGRSLGVHLVLATQRPGHAISDDIRANTNLRIALRVQDPAESVDVVGTTTASRLPRRRPGRAVVRLGADEELVMQTARVTAAAANEASQPVRIRPFGSREATPAEPGGRTDLELLVDAARRAARALGLAAPRRPWLDPLPAAIGLDAMPPGTVALADDPDHQCRHEVGWDPPSGHVLLCGGRGSGTTTALAALALDVARRWSPDEAHLLVADLGGGTLAPLAGLPHTGAVVTAGDRERIERFVRVLRQGARATA